VQTAAHYIIGKSDLAPLKPPAILIITAKEDDKLLAIATGVKRGCFFPDWLPESSAAQFAEIKAAMDYFRSVPRNLLLPSLGLICLP